MFLFSNLSEKDINEIISLFDCPIHYKKDDIIYSANNFSKAIGYVISGEATAVTNNNNCVLMKTFSKGQVFGAAAVFGESDGYISNVIAKTDMEVLFIYENTLKEIFIKYPQTALNYITFLSDKVRFLNKKLNLISCLNAEDAVYKYLVGIKDSENYVKIPVSMTQLSKMLGLGRATLYRSLDNLEIAGKIQRENNKIKVIQNEKNY